MYTFEMNASDSTELDVSCAISKVEGMTALVVNIFAAVFGSVGNILVCATVYSNPRLHKSWCYLVCSLALADLLVNVVVQPVEAFLSFKRINGVCETFLRDAFRLFAYITCGASLMNMAFLSVERCLSIAWPFKRTQMMTRSKFIIALLTVWGIPILLGVSGQAGEGTRLSSILILIGLVVCYGVILTSYAILFVKARNHFKVSSVTSALSPDGKNATTLNNKKQNLRSNKRRESERRVARTVAIVILLFTVSWFLYGIVLVHDPEQNINSFYVWAVTIGLTNSALNPIVYFFSSKDFRDSSNHILRSVISC